MAAGFAQGASHPLPLPPPPPWLHYHPRRISRTTTAASLDDEEACLFAEQQAPSELSLVLEGEQHKHKRNSSLRDALRRAESALASSLRSSTSTALEKDRLAQQKAQSEIVDFAGAHDAYEPKNWSFGKKISTTLLYGVTSLGPTLASSIYAPAVRQVAEEFNVDEEMSQLGVAVLLLGFGLGALLWAPLSEVYGRKPAVIVPYAIATIFSFATGAAYDIGTVLITRFLLGFFGSAPLAIAGGLIGDLWTAQERVFATVGYSIFVIGGPTLGPVVGGAIVQSSLHWRWTGNIVGIYMAAVCILNLAFLDESFSPKLLVRKARRLRLETGNWALHAKHEEWDVSFRELANKYLVRPFQMLGAPICFLISLYGAFVYGLLYASLSTFPIVFQEERGWDQIVGALPFLTLLLGVLLGSLLNIANQKYYSKCCRRNDNRPVPEARLPPVMIGSLMLPLGIFILAATSLHDFHWVWPNLGIVFVGIGFTAIFQASMTYLIDTSAQFAASAVAAATFLRSVAAAASPLYVGPLIYRLGAPWGISIFGYVAVLLIPIPFLFFFYGKRIRARSRWSNGSS